MAEEKMGDEELENMRERLRAMQRSLAEETIFDSTSLTTEEMDTRIRELENKYGSYEDLLKRMKLAAEEERSLWDTRILWKALMLARRERAG